MWGTPRWHVGHAIWPIAAACGPYQTLQEPGRPGNNDEDILDQFGDGGHLLALRTFVCLMRKGQEDDGLLLGLNPIGKSYKAARLVPYVEVFLCMDIIFPLYTSDLIDEGLRFNLLHQCWFLFALS